MLLISIRCLLLKYLRLVLKVQVLSAVFQIFVNSRASARLRISLTSLFMVQLLRNRFRVNQTHLVSKSQSTTFLRFGLMERFWRACSNPKNKLLSDLRCLTQLPLVRVRLSMRASLLALVKFRLDDPDAARAAAEQAAALMRQTSPLSYLSLPGYAALAEVWLAQWESGRDAAPRSLKTAARRACQALRGYARVFPVGRARALLWQGLFDWLSGRPYLARQQWQQAIAAAIALGMPYDEALARYQLGRHLPIDDPARREQLTRASQIFAQLGAGYDLSLARSALTRYDPTAADE